jgi:hypothetical protein
MKAFIICLIALYLCFPVLNAASAVSDLTPSRGDYVGLAEHVLSKLGDNNIYGTPASIDWNATPIKATSQCASFVTLILNRYFGWDQNQ